MVLEDDAVMLTSCEGTSDACYESPDDIWAARVDAGARGQPIVDAQEASAVQLQCTESLLGGTVTAQWQLVEQRSRSCCTVGPQVHEFSVWPRRVHVVRSAPE